MEMLTKEFLIIGGNCFEGNIIVYVSNLRFLKIQKTCYAKQKN